MTSTLGNKSNAKIQNLFPWKLHVVCHYYKLLQFYFQDCQSEWVSQFDRQESHAVIFLMSSSLLSFLPQSLWPSQWSTLGYRKHRHSIAFSLCNKHLTIKQTDELFWRPALLVFSFSSLYNGCTQKKMYIPTKTLYVKRKVKRLYGIFFTHYCSVLVDVVGAFPYTCAGPTSVMVHLGCSVAQVGVVKPVKEQQISVTQFDPAQPKLPMVKQRKHFIWTFS